MEYTEECESYSLNISWSVSFKLGLCPAQGIALRTRRLDATYVYSDIPPLAFSDVVTKV